MNDNDDASVDHRPGLRYIQEHEEITNVLLTGRDPLILGTRRLREIMSDVAAVPHLSRVVVGGGSSTTPEQLCGSPTAERRLHGAAA